MDDVTVDIDQRRTVVAPFHFMGIPKLVVKRFAGHQSVLISGLSMPRVLRRINNPLACEADGMALH
jgi:hypothetical protein